MPTNRNDYSKSYNEALFHRSVKLHMTKCVCPRCSGLHELKTYHVGPEPARKFCFLCGLRAEHDYSDGISIGYGDKR